MHLHCTAAAKLPAPRCISLFPAISVGRGGPDIPANKRHARGRFKATPWCLAVSSLPQPHRTRLLATCPRLAPFTYAAGGKRLTLREANGQLLVRTGGGYEVGGGPGFSSRNHPSRGPPAFVAAGCPTDPQLAASPLGARPVFAPRDLMRPLARPPLYSPAAHPACEPQDLLSVLAKLPASGCATAEDAQRPVSKQSTDGGGSSSSATARYISGRW
jgi:hypothetical protein